MTTLLLAAWLVIQGAVGLPAEAGVVRGTAFFSDGLPAPGAVVWLNPIDPDSPDRDLPDTQTDSSGRYEFGDLEPGKYTVGAGYGRAAFGEARAGKTTRIITVTNDANPVDTNITLEIRGFKISGHVSGIPPEADAGKVRVILEREDYGMAPQRLSLSKDRSFSFVGVPPGDYTIVIAGSHADPLPVSVTDSDRDIELVVPPLIQVHGTITLERGVSLSRSTLIRFHGQADGFAPVTDKGTFDVALPPGEYHLNVSGLSDRVYVKTLEKDSENLLTTPLRLVETETPLELTMTLGTSTGVRVQGHVAGGGGNTTAGRLYWSSVITPYSIETAVGAHGEFEIPKLMPGEYLVRLGLSRDVSSPTLPVAIPAEDVTDLVITAPQARQVFGDVVVQGNGPLPRFTLLLMRAEQPSESDPRRTGLATLSERAGERLEKAARGGFAYLVKLSIDPTADGTFNFRLPEGFYRIFLGPQDPIPRAYRLISLTSGAVNLFTDGLKIDATENVWIHVGFATVADDPWVKVSGRVIGLDPVEGVFRVALRSEFTSAIETPINLDGSFEFPRVLRQTEYSVQLVPQKRIASAPAIRVADKDVSNVEIVIPKERDIRGRVTVEGSAPIPVFQLSLGSANPPSTPLTIKMPDGRDLPFLRPSESLSDESNVFHVRPDRDGWFQIKLPEGDYRVGIRGLPNGYALAAMTYGGVNLSGQPLKLAGSGTAELEIALANNPDIHRPEVRGKVRGLSAEHGGTLVRLSSLSSFLTLDAVVNADGAFRFEAVPPDAYLASLSGGGAQLSVTPFLITVPSTGDVNLDFVARQEPRSTETPNDIAPSSVGVTVAELGFTASASANESAAVANLRTLNTAQVTFLSTSGGKYGDIDALVNAGLLDTRFLTTVSGYMFSIINQGGDYLAVGVPAKPNNGQFAFYTTPDGVVRYATADGFAPADEAGKPVQ